MPAAVLLLAVLFLLPGTARKSFHYHDAEIYISAAANMARGHGDLSRPCVGAHRFLPFTEHPPLWIFVQSLWYRLWDVNVASTNAFPSAVLLLGVALVGWAAWRAARDARAIQWAALALVLNPVAAKWSHEPLLDWGLMISCSVLILLLTMPGDRHPAALGFGLGAVLAWAALSKGAFAAAFLPAVLLHLARPGRRRAAMLGFAAGIAIPAGAWALVDGPEWTITRSVIAMNVAPRLGRSPWPHVLPVLGHLAVRLAPWSLVAIAGSWSVYRARSDARGAALIVLTGITGYIVAGKLLDFYLLMLAPAIAYIAALRLHAVRAGIERPARLSIIVLWGAFIALRPFVDLEKPSNRAPEVREFLSAVRAVTGEATVGWFDCQHASPWYLLSYGWNHFGLDFELACLEGDEAAKYETKVVPYLHPCSAAGPPSYLIMPVNGWDRLGRPGVQVLSRGDLALIRLEGPKAREAPPFGDAPTSREARRLRR